MAQPGLSPEPGLLYIYDWMPAKTSPQGSVPLDISYPKVDAITSLSIHLAQVYYPSKKCSFFFFFVVYRSEKGKLVLMSVCQYLFSVLSMQPGFIVAMVTHWMYSPVSIFL